MENIAKHLKTKIYAKYIDSPFCFDVIPQIIGYERCSPSKQTVHVKNRVHNVLHFVLSGKGYYHINGQKYEIGENELFFYPSMSTAHYAPDPQNPWEYIWIEFSGIAGDSLCKSAGFNDGAPTYAPRDAAALRQEFTGFVRDTLTPDAGNALMLTARLLKVFGLLLIERNEPKIKSSHSSQHELIASVNAYIAHNLHDGDISLESLSRRFLINPTYLDRLFKTFTGAPLIRTLINLRMQKAMLLLRDSSFSIKEIAEMVGYGDPFYFSNKFKEHFDISPSRVRKDCNP
ncbi:MAG: helix-turn-helix domain-containing protein [Clostridiales bacterium]|jgi:AraC-like DNA-binding protein/mannose-6-phosphate isomerase-like protein (cupin superfamily)|nr:helix-turn-helix domain-containing protein [Clostridiales bacterium]